MLRWLLFVTAGALTTFAFAAAAHAQGRCGTYAWCNTQLSPDQRATMLLGALTDEQKISLLVGDDETGVCDCYQGSHTGANNGVAGLVPPMNYTDGPVGVRQGSATAMPIPIALAATFSPALARAYGTVIGNEAKDKGNDEVFAPTINILRTPYWGRAFEGFGEDPFLTSQLVVPWIEGAQSQGVIADVKHYAVYNQEGQSGPPADSVAPGQLLGPPATQGSRYDVDVHVDQRTLREIYLPAFEAAVEQANPGSVMCSYPQINGQFACENQELLTQILRDQWGYKGYVLADYGAAHNTIASMQNGLDFEPWPGLAYNAVAVNAALATGQATQAELDDHVFRILRTMFAFGIFDRQAYPNDDNLIDKQGHALEAQVVEANAATLLENRRATLPLRPRKLRSIAVIGSPASQFVTGGGSAAVTPFFYTTPLQAITARAGSRTKVTYDDGSNVAQAVADARSAGAAIVFAADYETEGSDRYCLTLECPTGHGDQDALIQQVAAANPKTIVVLETGGPVLTPWRNQVGALLEAWYPGEEGGPAITQVLFGDVDPGGRLPETWPAAVSQLSTNGDPSAYPGVAENVYYKEGVLVGYRWYDSKHLTPAFPFGYGLSYATWRYADLRIKRLAGPGASVSFTVANTSRRPGDDVAQLYLGLPQPAPGVIQPPEQLKGFERVSLGPGVRARLTLTVTPRDLSYWDVGSNSWRIARGCYAVMVGRSSGTILLRGTLGVGGARCAAASRGRVPARRVRRGAGRARPAPQYTG